MTVREAEPRRGQDWRKTADAGDALGQAWCALCIELVVGVAADKAEVVKWYRKANAKDALERLKRP